MSNYRRPHVAGGTYFITQVTYQRQPWLCSELARTALRVAIESVRQQYPFSIDAFVLLHDHFHCIWTLPPGDSDYSTRLRLIKGFVTKQCGNQLALPLAVCASRQKRGERNLWQRRFWEHLIRDEKDFARHCDYIHYNPVAHGLCQVPQHWQFSSLHRLMAMGFMRRIGEWMSGGLRCRVGMLVSNWWRCVTTHPTRSAIALTSFETMFLENWLHSALV